MYTGLLHLHNLLRWIILILLLVALVQSFTKTTGLKKTSLFLLIAAHITLLIGLYQWFVGPWGFQLIQHNGFSAVMKNNVYRFWAVEHMGGMIIAILLITIGRSKSKRLQYKAASWLYLIAMLIIIACIPWPFREGIARAIFPGVH